MNKPKWMTEKKDRILILSKWEDGEEYQNTFKINMNMDEWNELHPMIFKAGYNLHFITPEDEIEISLEQLKESFKLDNV